MRERAKTVMLSKTPREKEPLFQPNSEINGLNNTPMENRAPELMKRIKNEAASTYQP
jgi:hypothetical protein